MSKRLFIWHASSAGLYGPQHSSVVCPASAEKRLGAAARGHGHEEQSQTWMGRAPSCFLLPQSVRCINIKKLPLVLLHYSAVKL